MTRASAPDFRPSRALGTTGLVVSPVCLGGNVFGWTADESTSRDVLDAYVGAGGNAIDTADSYSHWVPGNAGGESETIVGDWMASRRNRESLVIATKVGKHPMSPGLSAANIASSIDGSLRRLRTDYIDLYYAHLDDPDVALEESLAALDEAVQSGKVRQIAASNYSAARLQESLDVADRAGLTRFAVLQNNYNLMDRDGYEGSVADVVVRNELASLPFYGLARGFLTGKYRAGQVVDSPRAAGAAHYAGHRGDRVLAALDVMARVHATSMATVALAWLAAQPSVTAPIASARNVEQLAAILAVADVRLEASELDLLDEASA